MVIPSVFGWLRAAVYSTPRDAHRARDDGLIEQARNKAGAEVFAMRKRF
ncbi:MAG: hypothetical protein ACOH2I_10020 [Pseudomonas sp.]